MYISVTEFDGLRVVVKWWDRHTVNYTSQDSQSSTELYKHLLVIINRCTNMQGFM